MYFDPIYRDLDRNSERRSERASERLSEEFYFSSVNQHGLGWGKRVGFQGEVS
jgi:hypothetical protein